MANTPPRFPYGYYEVGFSLQGTFDKLPPREFRDLLSRALRNHSGWPPFVIIDRPPYVPKFAKGAVETWMGPEPDGTFMAAAHSDYWRISPEGFFYTRRGFSEDEGYKGAQPGKYFSFTTSIWRIGETILQAGYVAKALNSVGANLVGEFNWKGLARRELFSGDNPSALSIRRVATDDSYRCSQVMAVDFIPDALPEIVFAILEPLYQLFDFWQLPRRLVETELQMLTAHSYG